MKQAVTRLTQLTFVVFCAVLACQTLLHGQSIAQTLQSFRPVQAWPQLPDGWSLGGVSGVAIDKDGDILIFNRGDHPVIEFKPDGKFMRSFGEGAVATSHGLRVDPQNNIWTTDVGNHTVTKHAHDGRVLMVLGEKGTAGDDATHFNKPADIAFARDGNIFVADGYGNSRVAKFDRDGKFIKAWGKKGTGPGEFNLVHAVALDSKGLLYVADRENNRVQIFDQDGKFIRMWTHLGAPFGFFMTPQDRLYITDGRAHKVTVVNRAGKVLHTFGSPGTGPGEFQLPHDIVVSQTGEVYVGEITNKRIQKFQHSK